MLWLKQSAGELMLRGVGLSLAGLSTAFAIHMISNEDHVPEFPGIEHLSIFSKPSLITR
jgi:hypothetical protein